MEIVNSPHDKFFKKSFEDIKIAKDFLINYLPKDILELVDINKLDHEKGSFIEDELKGLYSDVLFRTNVNGTEGYVYFLIEHKSYKEKRVALQLLKYIIKIWELKVGDDNNKKFPVVIPMVFYHNKREWNIDLSLSELIDGYETLPTKLLKYIPNFEYLIYDFSPKSDKIKGSIKLQSILKLMRFIHIKDLDKFFAEIINVIRDLEQEENIRQILETIIYYVMSARNDVNKENMTDAFEKSLIKGGDVVMTMADKLRQEGRQEGKIETAKELIKIGLDVKQIAQATKLSIDEINKIKNDMK